jgi:hypothetical protein
MEMSTRSYTNRIDWLDSGKEVVTAFEDHACVSLQDQSSDEAKLTIHFQPSGAERR